jgi:hypothetical protein
MCRPVLDRPYITSGEEKMKVSDRSTILKTTETVESSTTESAKTINSQAANEVSHTSTKASQQNAIARRSEAMLESQIRQSFASNIMDRVNTQSLRQIEILPGMSFSELSEGITNVIGDLKEFPGMDQMIESFTQIDTMLSSARNLSLSPDTDIRAALGLANGTTDQAETALHDAFSNALTAGLPPELAEAFGPILQQIASLIAGLQGRPGQEPLGYPEGFVSKVGREKGESAPQKSGASSPEDRAKRMEEAKQLKESGGLGAAKSDKPKLSEAEQKSFDAGIAAADDDAAVAMSNNPKALAAATPEQKAKLIRELMSGSTTDGEDRAIARILQSCTSKAEFDQVIAQAGGHTVFEELDDDAAKNMFREAEGRLGKQQQESSTKAVELLEKADSPEEAKELATQLGGTEFKHNIKDPELLKRLDAVAKRFDMPALGYGMPAETVQQKRDLINQAATKEDSKLAVQLSEDRDAMKVASPAEKAKLIKELQRGWTKDSQDMAIYKVLSSCTSKAEFDEVVKLSGGIEVLQDMDHEETRGKINELYGAWGRVDLADDKQRAKQFENVLADPQKQAELSATRKPNQDELNQVGGNYKTDPKDANDPLMQTANQAMGAVKGGIQDKAFDVNWDPQAKNELVLEQRRREVEGKPKLDWTALTAEADKVTSDPDFEKKVAEYAKQNDIDDPKEAREKYVTAQMQPIAAKHGLSEQTMKSLVTQRMGQIYNKGAEEMAGYSNAITAPLKQQLAQIEKTKGPNSPEAVELRARISKFEQATGTYAQHLGNVGETYKSLFPVPPSFAEDFVSSFSFIADIAAAVCSVIPGVGPVISGVYYGVKAIAAAAQGDILGMFSSVASAIPGLGTAVGGAAGAAMKTAGRAAQTAIGVGTSVANGNVMGAFGSLAGVGSGIPAFDYAQKGINLADGIRRGDTSAIFGAAGGMLGPVANNPAVQNIVQNPIVQGVSQYAQKAAPFIEGIVNGDVSKAIGAGIAQLAPLAANNPEVARVVQQLTDGAKFVEAMRNGDYGKALTAVIANQQLLGNGPQSIAFTQALTQSSNLLMAMGSGDVKQIANVLQGQNGVWGFMNEMLNKRLSNSMSEVSNIAAQTLNSSEFQSAIDLTRSGGRFLGAIESGDLRTILNGTNGIGAQLSQMFGSAQPFLQSMSRGDLNRVLDELRKNPTTAGIADQLAMFEPFANMLSGDFQQSLEMYESNLKRLASVGGELDQFRALEESAKHLQERFGEDYNAMAEYLLESSEYRGSMAAPIDKSRLVKQRQWIQYA